MDGPNQKVGFEHIAAKPYVEKWWKKEGVLGFMFASQEALRSRIRSIVNQADLNTHLGEQDTSFLIDVLRRHHRWEEKQGVGVHSLVVRLNPPPGFGSATRGIWIVRKDGSETDISWVTPLQRGGASTAKKDVALAARREVSDQTRSMHDRMRGTPCPICGEPLRQVHIDHVAPLTFERLLSDWLKLEGLNVGAVEVSDLGIENAFADRELAARWAKYHERNAILRAIHPHENLSAAKRSRDSA